MDVISSSGWLNPALTAMEMSQMAAQAVWDRDSHLLQLPHVTKELAAKAAAAGVETVFDLQEMEVRPLPYPSHRQGACVPAHTASRVSARKFGAAPESRLWTD